MAKRVYAATLFCAVICAGLLTARLAAAATVRATVDQRSLRVGESTVLSIEVRGASDAPPPNLGVVEGFRAAYLGPSTQVSFVNGQVSQSITHRYSLAAEREGRFRLGPFDVAVGSDRYQTLPITIDVAKAAKPKATPRAAGGVDVSLELEVPYREVFVRQRMPASVTLLIGSTRVDDVQYPDIKSEVFSVESFGKPVQRRQVREGRTYQSVRFDTFVIPLRAGTLTLGPASQSMSIVTRSRRRDPIFGGLFGSERRPHEAYSNAETIVVKALPKAGRPADFSGAVGRFDLKVEARPKRLQVNDPITVTMRVTGDGNLASASLPKIEGEGLKTYPPRRVRAAEDPRAWIVEQVVIPTSSDVTELPAVRFSYFDPSSRAYRTAIRGPIPVVVQGASAAREPAVEPGRGVTEGSQRTELGKDIVYVKDDPGALSRKVPVYRSPLFLSVQLVPLLGFLAALVVTRRRERLRGDPGYARFARAGRDARRAIDAAVRATANDGARQCDDLARAVREYLAAKLALPPGAVDPARVAERLGDSSAPVVRRIAEFFDVVESLRYAPGSDGQERRPDVAELAREIVRELERRKGLAGRFDSRGRALLACLWVLAAASIAGAAPDENPMPRFFEANAAYARGEYAAAVTGYRELLEAGYQSGELHYNLANALLKTGELGNAIGHYERARRLLPRDPDVKANLAFAMEQVAADPAAVQPPPPLWLRLSVPLAFRATTEELAVAGSLVYWLAMGCLVLRALVPRRRNVFTRAAFTGAVLLVFIGSAFIVRYVNEEVRRVAVVVRSGAVPVRFEPSQTGTVHFTLPEGVLVEERERRDGWSQVARADGRRGWLPSEAIDIL